MDIVGLVGRLPGGIGQWMLARVNSWERARLWVSRRVINGYAYAAPLRPRPLSMAGDYTTWPGLTDRRYSGRHLGAADGAAAPAHPPIDAVVELFRRARFQPANDTSLLFAFFAQWFTDGFLRTKWEEGPDRKFRENESNHEIDLCQIYGSSEAQTHMLREGDGGRLRTQTIGGEDWPAPLFEERDGNWALIERYAGTDGAPGLYTPANFARVTQGWTDEDRRHAFAVGLEHGNSTLGQVLMNALFVREHNRTAGILEKAHPDWGDERLFQTARNVTIAVLLNIVISDYIVHIAPIPLRLEAHPGMAEQERWYRTNWIAVEFALLYRWHDLIPDAFKVGDEVLPGPGMRHANGWLRGRKLEDVLLAASAQPAGHIGLGNTADFLLGVKKLSVEMGRACRLPSFNAYRRHYGLPPVTSFEALTGEREKAAKLRELYGDIERLEWFVGLFAEAYGPSEMMGRLLVTMVANDAFTQALTNPLLASAVHNAATFGPEGYRIVRETSRLAQVVARNTNIADEGRIGFTLPTRPAG